MRLTVMAPCRNEAAHITAFCQSVAAQQLPPGVQLQVLVADGQSDDGTRALLDAWCAQDARFAVVDNPGRIVSCGLNRCIAQAEGEVIARLDIHTVYAPDYLAQCLQALERSGADNVGGPWQAAGRTPWQRAVALAFQSRWVAGGARSRDLAYEGEADTVYLGCWPRATFARFGGFDEQLVRNQDDEHNLRIRRGGGRVWQSARIRSSYFPRARLGQVARQYLQYGYWKPFVMRKHGQPAALRQLVPAMFLIAIFGVIAYHGAGFYASWVPAAGLALAYGAYLLAALWGMRGALCAGGDGAEGGGRRGAVGLAARVVAVVLCYHLAYGWGSLRGWFDVLRGRAPNPRYGVLTR